MLGSYIILQGLAGSAGGFLAIVQLIVYYVKLIILGNTPRSIYNIKFAPRSVAWGTLFPVITLITVISQFANTSRNSDADGLYSSRLLHHCSYHQRACCSRLLPVLPTLQIPFLVPTYTTSNFGHWRLVLSQSHSSCIRGLVRPAALSLCTILPLSG